MKNTKKLIRNLIIFVLLIILTFYMLLKDQDIFEIFRIIKNVKIEYIIIAILCMCVYIILEAVNMGRTLKKLGEKSSFFNNVKYSLIGFFFSSITPAASGGQPMQIYYMKKDKISVANSTLALLVNLTSMQVVTIGLAFVSLIFNYQYLNGALMLFFIIGISLNISALALLVISITSKRMTNGLINFAVKVMKFFRIRNVEAKQERLKEELDKYQQSSGYIRGNKKIIFKTILTTLIQFFFYYSITYWVYCSFGLEQKCGILKIVSMQSLVYATVSGIPSPGAIGVSEGAFIEIFKNVYPVSMINGVVILNRGINFYLFVIISAVVSLATDILKIKKESKTVIPTKKTINFNE